jgi:uncharacterized protein (TIGR03437 family)
MYSNNLGTSITISTVLTDAAGDLFVVYTSSPYVYALKYNSTGGTVYSNNLGTSITISTVLTDAAGNLFVVYTSSPYVYALKYNSTGGTMYSNNLGTSISITTVLSDSAGDLFVVYTSSPYVYALKYNSTGGTMYSNNLGTSISISSMLTDTAGDLFVTYTSSPYIYALKYNSTGGTTYSNNLGTGITLSSVLTDTTGDLFVVYTSNSSVNVTMLNATGGVGYSVSIGGGSSGGGGGGSGATAPAITTQPASQSIASGQSATLTVAASGTAPLTYQWYQGASGDTASPVGSNSSAFTTPALSSTTKYWVRVSNSAGAADSATATIAITVTSAAIPVVSGVSNAASGRSGAVAGSFVSIYGSNFTALALDEWSRLIGSNGQLPTQMDDVSVTVGGKPAYINVIAHAGGSAPDQINAQVPDLPAGSAAVIVTTAAGASAPYMINVLAAQPALWPWPNGQPVATHAGCLGGPDCWAVKNGSFSSATSAARPGEIIALWGTGFGPTNPAVPAGQIPGSLAGSPTQYSVAVQLNGVPLATYGSAISGFPGDYQINVQIPASQPDGDFPLTISVNGISSPAYTFTVRR